MSFWDRLVHTFRSRYILSLEARIIELQQDLSEERADNHRLLDRIIFITTGAPLDPYKPAPGEVEATPEATRAALDAKTKGGGEPFSFSGTMQELMANAEAETMERALRERGFEDEIVEGAEIRNAMNNAKEEEQQREAGLKAVVQRAVAEGERIIREKVPVAN